MKQTNQSIDFTPLVIGIAALLVFALSSCASSGYGCHGRTKSFNGVVWRINKFN